MEGMKGSISISWPLMLSLWMALVVMFEVRIVGGEELSPSQCREERQLGLSLCKVVVFGIPPSPACCERVRVSHFECVCPAIDPKLAVLVNVNRAIKLLTDCGRRVPRHFKCGSINFP